MKNLIFAMPVGVFMAALFASCATPRFRVMEPVPAYLVSKDSKPIPVDYYLAVKHLPEDGTRIVADDRPYNPAKVQYYGDGIKEYGNIKDTIFAKKVVSGNIDLFTNKLNASGNPASLKPLFYYTGLHYSPQLRPLSYRTLADIIPSSHKAHRYLSRYKKLNRISFSFGGVGMGVATAGFFQILADKKGTPGIPSNPNGVIVSAIGVWSFITGAILHEENKSNLFMSVKKFNDDH